MMLALLPLWLAAADLRTVAETSNFQRTGRYDEVVRLCEGFEKTFPARARCERFGTTPEGRPMLALVLSSDGTLTAAAATRRQRPVVLVQAGIHAGEIDGKDAGFWLFRELLEGPRRPTPLDKVTVVFVPVFNVDGHERFGPNHRPNQRGPEQMGWRTTAQNLNLNRDFAKAEAPETAALLGLLRAWDPLLLVDLHVTDGAKFQHDISVCFEPVLAGKPGLVEPARALRDAVVDSLRAKGHLPVTFYPSFVKEDDPASGFALGIAPPRFAQTYWAMHNRLGVLVEAHSWKDYATRVLTQRHTLEAILAQAALQGPKWRAAAREADAADAQEGGDEVTLAYEHGPASHPIDFLGFAYTRETSPVSGQAWVRYDESRPQVWRVPLFDEVHPAVTAPLAQGYLVPAAHAAWVAKKLDLHGLRYRVLKRAAANAPVEAFRATLAQFRPGPYEGRQAVTLTGAWAAEPRDVPAGSLFVPTAQPARALVVQLFEPLAPDSLVAWGFFNSAFEQKEYMEDYVAEDVARALLADPSVKQAFDERLADPGFAKSPEARLRFFYQRHPSWDERYNLYPVLRARSWAPPD